MASKKSCVVGGCRTVAKTGLTVCSDHQHTLVLQAEIVRLNQTQPDGVSVLVRHHPHLRRLIENLATLTFRADPLKAIPTQVVGRSRGHNLSDGIVTLGDHVVTPGYAVSTKKDEGRLGAAIAKVKVCADEVDKILDPHTKRPRDTRPKCGSRACTSRDTRQDHGSAFCKFCGRDMRVSA